MTGAGTFPPEDAVRFDQRPGDLEATRGLDAARVYAMGYRTLDGWRVQLLRDGVPLALLTTEHARELACDLGDYAALLEHGYAP